MIKLGRSLTLNLSEFVIIYVHKSASTPYDKYKRILNKIVQRSAILDNQFNASTRLGGIRGKILVMEINSKDEDSYIDQNKRHFIVFLFNDQY